MFCSLRPIRFRPPRCRPCRLGAHGVQPALLPEARSKDSWRKRPRDPKAQNVASVDGKKPVAVRHAEALRIGDPRPATEDAYITISGHPRGAVRGRAVVAAIQAILYPFIHIAVH